MNFTQKIVKLNEERYGLDFVSYKEYVKIKEELDEFNFANSEEEMIDALADIIVIAIGSIRKLGYDPECVMNQCVDYVYQREQDPEQKKRWERGEKEEGEKWIKDKTQQLKEPDYEQCKLGS